MPETLVCPPLGHSWPDGEVGAGTPHLPSSGFGPAVVCRPKKWPKGRSDCSLVYKTIWRGQLAQGPHRRCETACPSPACLPRSGPCLLGCSRPSCPRGQVPEALCLVLRDSEPGPSQDPAAQAIPRPQPHRQLRSSLEPASPQFHTPEDWPSVGTGREAGLVVSPQASASRFSPLRWSLPGWGTALSPSHCPCRAWPGTQSPLWTPAASLVSWI